MVTRISGLKLKSRSKIEKENDTDMIYQLQKKFFSIQLSEHVAIICIARHDERTRASNAVVISIWTGSRNFLCPYSQGNGVQVPSKLLSFSKN